MTAILTYEGHSLYECGCGYMSEIEDEWVEFDTVSQWKQYIDKLTQKV